MLVIEVRVIADRLVRDQISYLNKTGYIQNKRRGSLIRG